MPSLIRRNMLFGTSARVKRFIAANTGMLKTSSDGVSWTTIFDYGDIKECVWCFGYYWVVALDGKALYKTLDFTNWEAVSTGMERVLTVSSDGNVLFIGGQSELYYNSSYGGYTRSGVIYKTTNGIDFSKVKDIGYESSVSNIVYLSGILFYIYTSSASGVGAVYYITNFTTYESVLTGLSGTGIRPLFHSSDIVMFGSSNITSNDSLAWSRSNGLVLFTTYQISMGISDGSFYYTRDIGGNIMKSNLSGSMIGAIGALSGSSFGRTMYKSGVFYIPENGILRKSLNMSEYSGSVEGFNGQFNIYYT